MADKKDLENMMQQADQPFSSPAFDTFTAAWAVSQRKKKAATSKLRARLHQRRLLTTFKA